MTVVSDPDPNLLAGDGVELLSRLQHECYLTAELGTRVTIYVNALPRH